MLFTARIAVTLAGVVLEQQPTSNHRVVPCPVHNHEHSPILFHSR